MAEKIYEVLEGQSYTGKNKVYKAGQKFTESELFGLEEEGLEIALSGQKEREIKNSKGEVVKKYAAVEAKIKEVKTSKGAKK